ncbi:MAG: amidohydrolase [Anaerolineae bacterium]|nr:amidohydrolase [Anaerolineae bacterium]MCB9461838.1 amidohydrolase [Anaerolineaceae bacterium]
MDYFARAAQLQDQMVTIRRDFHQHPELGFQEHRTSSMMAESLAAMGYNVQTGIAKTGVVAFLEGAHDGPTIILRCDMDALPIQEMSDAPYRSQEDGCMHACGHDGHMAIALATAQILAEQREQMHGNVRLVCQPGEEGHGGMLRMIDDGLLEMEPEADIALGLHLWSPLKVGTVGIAAGATMSGSSVFRIKVQGKGGHAAMPHTTIDPVACAGQLITALHTIVGRKMNAMDGAVILSVTGVQTSTNTHNIIPETVEITGTFRTFNAYTSELLEQHVRDVSRSVCQSVGCTADVHVRHLTIPTVNDKEVVHRVKAVFSKMLNAEQIIDRPHTMASDDFSYVLDEIPGVYFFVGISNDERGINFSHHHPRFDMDEDALTMGAGLLSAATAAYILPNTV